MLKRVLSSIVGLPILLLFVVLGGWPLKAAVFFLIAIAMHELYDALSKKRMSIHYVGYLFAAVYMVFIDSANFSFVLSILLIAFTVLVSILLVIFHNRINVMDCAATMFGFYYVAVLMSLIYVVRMSTGGQYLVWIIFIAAWGCDTGAYFAGITLGRKGKHKLIPSLSPNKTVEGAIGGIVVASILAVVYGAILARVTSVRVVNEFETFQLLVRYAVIGAGGAIFAQLGDLAASAIKRYTNIKDFGHIIPGHGGVMDRFDSVLFTAPAVYVISLILIHR